jgi:hypothetical protein
MRMSSLYNAASRRQRRPQRHHQTGRSAQVAPSRCSPVKNQAARVTIDDTIGRHSRTLDGCGSTIMIITRPAKRMNRLLSPTCRIEARHADTNCLSCWEEVLRPGSTSHILAFHHC